MTKKKLKDFTPQRANANKHTERGIALLDKSIRQDGWIGAVTVANDGETFDGSARLERIGEVMADSDPIVVDVDGTRPVILRRTDIASADDPRAKRLAVAANAIASADWNPDGDLLAQLAAEDDYIAQLVKSDDKAAKAVLESTRANGGNDAEPQIDRAEELRVKWGVESGQLWKLGEHRLICGDCTDAATVARVMGGEKADIEIHDPPYGMGLDTDWSDAKSSLEFATEKPLFGGKKYDKVIGDDVDFDPSFLFDREHSKEMFLFGADYYADKLPNRNFGSWIIWDKRLDDSADKMYGSCFEMCWSMSPHKRDIARIKWAGVFGVEKEPERKRFHPTQKPVELYRWFLSRYSKDGSISLDFYLGAGSHLIACENLSRRCRAIEISPAYVAVALERWATATGKTPERIE